MATPRRARMPRGGRGCIRGTGGRQNSSPRVSRRRGRYCESVHDCAWGRVTTRRAASRPHSADRCPRRWRPSLSVAAPLLSAAPTVGHPPAAGRPSPLAVTLDAGGRPRFARLFFPHSIHCFLLLKGEICHRWSIGTLVRVECRRLSRTGGTLPVQ